MNLPVEIVPYTPAESTVAHGRTQHAHGHAEHGTGGSTAPSGGKFAPASLIFEGTEGQVLFAEMAALASVRSREQARLFYEQGVKETSLVNARRWRDVEVQHTREEVLKATEIASGLETIRKQDVLVKVIQREERSADPNPHLLDSLESRISALTTAVEAVCVLVFSATERELDLVKLLEQLKRSDRKARGWKLKAQRQVACGLFGRQFDAEKCGRSYFRRFRCRNRYCPHCGPYVHQQLVAKYLRLEKPVAGFLAEHPSYRLRVLDLTAMKRGERMPSPDNVRKFKADVKKLIERINRRIAEKFGLPYSKQLTGYLYCLEFGFDNNNLHCHGALLSPFIEQDWLSKQWREIRDDGSFVVWIADGWSFEDVVKHALEYTGKYAAPSAERAFELELAFVGCRRVDGLGWFFNRLPKEDDECDLRCPCDDPECFLKPNRELGWLPLSYFEERGIRDLDEARERGSPLRRRKDGGTWVN
jgi:hypothetical protein